MRSATVAIVVLFTVAASARAESPARALGTAWRAYQAGNYDRAYAVASKIDTTKLENADYALYVAAQSAAMLGNHAAAVAQLERLRKTPSSRFASLAVWRLADALWAMGRVEPARVSYERLVQRGGGGDEAIARFRIAEANAKRGKVALARQQLHALRLEYPAHPLASDIREKLIAYGGDASLDARDRIERAKNLKAAHLWHEAVAELSRIDDDEDPAVVRLRDYWLGMTYFSMRRRYGDAGRILLGLYEQMGGEAARALFHGARALSRADLDKQAIGWYQRVVAKYPRSDWAGEAQLLSGWLEFNMGNYREAVPYLEETRRRFPRSRWADSATWFLGLSHWFLGDYQRALSRFEEVAKGSDRLEDGKGRYWKARALQKLERQEEAVAEYRALVSRYPFSWYALLAHSRLKEVGVDLGPFGDAPRAPADAPAIDERVDERLARDPLIRAADELMAAGLDVEAGEELRRGERAFIRRHATSAALAILMDRYRKANNFNRPWMLAVIYGGSRALDAPPKGKARVWWEHAYPLAYRKLVEKHQRIGDNPPYYLYSIMRKESGFNPHTVSYADAIGLLQMIPPTTRRVVGELGLEYTSDLLYDPELNIRAGAWYIGHLLEKFKQQIPIGAGSFNSGPRPVMRWLDKNGERPIDEFIELVSYNQTRGYMKKVPEIYARYLYLYEGTIYEQPLAIDADYLVNDLTY